MIVVPAIDLLGGKAVRLLHGDRAKTTVYSDAPAEVAAGFRAAGASLLHIVDLDGAFAGAPRQHAAIAAIIAAAGIPVQVGGGVRDAAHVQSLLDLGVRGIVLGTAAVKDPAWVRAQCERHPGAIIVAVDARDGRVAVEGWTETSDLDAVALGRQAAAWGAARILYTDVARDGDKRGPNVAATARLQAALGATPVIASGGIGALADLRALAAAGIPYAVVGRALYDGAFTLAEALAAC
jgi:phosphoribosylformimino-5-aminoimidazole carboxamide ribotide isomerase